MGMVEDALWAMNATRSKREADAGRAKSSRVSRGSGAMEEDSAATHKGNFQEHLGVDVECYVLNDPSKTAVISQSGFIERWVCPPRKRAR